MDRRKFVKTSSKDYAGLFLYHCHNLKHEGMGMIRNYKITYCLTFC